MKKKFSNLTIWLVILVIGCCFERRGILEVAIRIMIDRATNDSVFKKVVDFE